MLWDTDTSISLVSGIDCTLQLVRFQQLWADTACRPEGFRVRCAKVIFSLLDTDSQYIRPRLNKWEAYQKLWLSRKCLV